MEIVKITQQNLSDFQEILPVCKNYVPMYTLGCVMENTAVGGAIMYLTENGCSLFWLWVAPEYRRKGAGGTLLDEMCKIALQTSGGNLSVTYPADAPWAYAMEYMLVSRGFRVRVHSYPQYRITREKLLEAPFMAHVKAMEHSNVIAFSKLPRVQLRDFIMENRQMENYIVSHADFDRADEERSMALIQKGRIEGVLLVSTDGGEDVVSLDLFYLTKAALHSALALVRQAALTALHHPAGLRELRFLCIDEASVRLCRSLMGEQKTIPEEYCHGILYTGFYRERGE